MSPARPARRFRYSEWVRRWFGLIVLACLAIAACAPQVAVEDYTGKIQALRAAKDESFKNDPDSPIPADKKAMLLPLAYFPIDELYAVPATLVPSADRARIQVPTSIGKIRDLEVVGSLKFTVKGQPMTLTAFMEITEPRSNRLFVPFADLTSGTETYPAGRYMELDPTPTGIYLIDFNIAYHPYCYYSPEYDCPFPPKENRLAVPIRAGEKMQKADSSIP
ncbi:MAG: hypothetical protein RLZZ53_143 [Acidobacteriota bacterium]|jgi:uncharacterized protein (DUF1684 family)